MSPSSYPPLKSLGQHFIKDGPARELVFRIPLFPTDKVVELGAGTGTFTFLLAERVSRILAVEIDAGRCRELKEKVDQKGNPAIEVLHQDLLKADWAGWYERIGEAFVLVGNLPYYISTPILFKIIEQRRLLRSAYVMLQKEVADRLLASPGTKSYGVLSVLIGYYAEARSLMDLPPGAFYPRPRVSSAFLGLTFPADPRPPLKSQSLFQWVVRAAFGRRRKHLSNALTGDGRFSMDTIRTALEQNGIDPKRRGETLSIPEFVSLANALADEESSAGPAIFPAS